MSPRPLPLHAEHVRLGARMAESEGWTMPVEFAGVFQEYRAHRNASVVWDSSNLGCLRVSGGDAFDLVQRTFTNDLRRCAVGRCQYTLLLSEADASIVDDVMVWRVESDAFLLMPNRPEEVLKALRSVQAAGPWRSCAVEDVSSGRVLLALQGAEAGERMAEMDPACATMPAYGVREAVFHGCPGFVAATGFGGRTGFELHLEPSAARKVYASLLARDVTPAGLGMRETHRLESGIPRHGYELVPGVTPLEADLARAVGFDTEFVGRAALERKRLHGVDRILRAVVMNGRRIPPRGSEVTSNGRRIGQVTSSNFSPRLHRGLAFAFVGLDVEVGSTVTIPTEQGAVEGEVATVLVGSGVAR